MTNKLISDILYNRKVLLSYYIKVNLKDFFTYEQKEKEGQIMAMDYSVIGRRIRTLRQERKMKQEQLADSIDVSVAFMSRIERGSTQINLKRLIQIAEILNVSPGYLLTGSNVESKDYLKEEFRQVLENCTPEQQRLIYQISELVSKTDFGQGQPVYIKRTRGYNVR